MFQSTRPMRGATAVRIRGRGFRVVSIHAPHAGRDRTLQVTVTRQRRFNPRAPCGARQWYTQGDRVDASFQSTRPMRGATALSDDGDRMIEVSIHAPHAGRDSRSRTRQVCSAGFNPRAPCGARRLSCCWSTPCFCFNPRAPCGARPRAIYRRLGGILFQSTRPMRGATSSRSASVLQRRVSIHAPHAGRDSL